MNFTNHSELVGQHAVLGASKWQWTNPDYSDERLLAADDGRYAIEHGIRMHSIAAEMIDLKIRPRRSKKTFNMFVNDAIGYDMKPERVLYYSPLWFGTADAISFENNTLRIFDLKTGTTPAHMEQLEIYAALFCLEYGYKPKDINIELRIYQNDEVYIYEPTSEEIDAIIAKGIRFDELLRQHRQHR